VDAGDTVRCSYNRRSCLEFGACCRGDALDTLPTGELATPNLALETFGGDGVEGEFEERFGSVEPEGLPKVGGVERVAEEDIEELASNAPAAPRKCVSQPFRGAIEATAEERLAGHAELAEIEACQVVARSLDETGFVTAGRGRTDGGPCTPILHRLQEEFFSVRHTGFGAA